MKRIITIILITSIIGGVAHLDELVKFPFLIHHYSEHKAQHPDDSVLTFLYKHYILNQKAESEKDRKSDSQMPFKSAQNFHSHFIPFVFENKAKQVVSKTAVKIFIPFKETKISTGFFDIWQPPKVS
jgi:hypothetical protein